MEAWIEFDSRKLLFIIRVIYHITILFTFFIMITLCIAIRNLGAFITIYHSISTFSISILQNVFFIITIYSIYSIYFSPRATWRWKATAAITQSLGSTLPMTWSSASRTREDSRWTLQLATITGLGKVLARGWRSGPKIRELAYGLTVQDSGILQV